MFGHQDEPQQQPQNDTATFTPATPDPVDPASDGTLDDNLAALATSDDTPITPPADTPALIEEHESDGKATDTPLPAPDPAAAPVPDTNVLLDIKQQALQQLSPLVDHLDQPPEEKFRTTMMMIQASDNQALLKVAYDAAQQIQDEKTRAQALLDVVNEINYFTQHHATN